MSYVAIAYPRQIRDAPPLGGSSRSYDYDGDGSSSELSEITPVSYADSSFWGLAYEKKIIARATESPFEGTDNHPTTGIASRGPSDSSTKGILVSIPKPSCRTTSPLAIMPGESSPEGSISRLITSPSERLIGLSVVAIREAGPSMMTS